MKYGMEKLLNKNNVQPYKAAIIYMSQMRNQLTNLIVSQAHTMREPRFKFDLCGTKVSFPERTTLLGVILILKFRITSGLAHNTL